MKHGVVSVDAVFQSCCLLVLVNMITVNSYISSFHPFNSLKNYHSINYKSKYKIRKARKICAYSCLQYTLFHEIGTGL